MIEPPIPPRRPSTDLTGPGYHVFYDADCGFCSRCVAWLARQRSSVPLSWVPIDSAEARAWAPDRPAQEMGIAGSGGIWFGGDAWVVCLWALPRYRWLARMMALPPVRPLVRRIYALVARNRYRISRLFGESCQIPQK